MKALAIGAGIVFWTLVLGVAVLVFFPGGDAGEPVAVLQIDTAPPAAPPKPPATTDNVQLPPGIWCDRPRHGSCAADARAAGHDHDAAAPAVDSGPWRVLGAT